MSRGTRIIFVKMKLENYFKKKKCAICGKEFLAYKSSHHKQGGKRKLDVRRSDCITCSRKCSRLLANKRYKRKVKNET